MQFINKRSIVIGVAALASIVAACCSDGCYCVKADSFTSGDCSGQNLGGGTAFANYGKASGCVDITNAQSLTLNNDGCGSSYCDVHFYTSLTSCTNDPDGSGGDIAYVRGTGGACTQKPVGVSYMRSVCA